MNKYDSDPYATHQPVLMKALEGVTGKVLELGAGDYSTHLINQSSASYILTIETDMGWANKFRDIASDRHQVLYMPEEYLKHFMNAISGGRWDVVFIDAGTYELRIRAIEIIKGRLIVIHDGEVVKDMIGLSKYYKYLAEYAGEKLPLPTTMLASNYVDVRDIEIKGMTKIS